MTKLRADRVAEVARHLSAAERSLTHQRAGHADAFRHAFGRLFDGLERAHVHPRHPQTGPAAKVIA